MIDRHKVKTPYPLRMPSDLREWMNSMAKENGRSLNSEIVQRLVKSKEQVPA